MTIPVSMLSTNQLTREYWGLYDSRAIARLARFVDDPCYQMKFYKAPAVDQEVLPAFGYVSFGLQITPGSIIFGFYLPLFMQGILGQNPLTLESQPYTVQITDVSLQHKFFDDPVASMFLSNYKPEFQTEEDTVFPGAATSKQLQGSFPNLLCAPHPVVGSGLFDVEIQETGGRLQRLELVFGVLEVCSV